MKKRIVSLILTLVMALGICKIPSYAASISVTPMVVAGNAHNLALRTNGEVWAWGMNSCGRLGNGKTDGETTTPVRINISNVIQMEASNHTVALKNNGEVWTWGTNGSGELGDGTTTDRTIPIKVNISNVIQISAGHSYTVALKNNGEVWAWGRNSSGELGNGTTINSYIPTKCDISNVKQIATGDYHTFALKNNGEVWAWGDNGHGQLGDGTSKDVNKSPVKINISNVKQIATGTSYTFALKNNGEVWAWGRNSSGELGNGTEADSLVPVKINISDVKQISAGGIHTVALKNNGEVWAWGSNAWGQLGIGGYDYSKTIPTKVNISNVRQVSAGALHTVVVKNNGEVWAWGDNGHGQLGDGTRTDRYVPVNIGFSVGVSGITSNKSTVYSTEQEKILNDLKIETKDIFSNISFGTHSIKGPHLDIFGKKVYLFEIDSTISLDIGNIPISLNVDNDKKIVRMMVGYKEESSKDNSQWSSTYNEIKNIYETITKNKVSTNELWNQFSKVRGKLKTHKSKLIVDAECTVGGFIEGNYETGEFKFSGGGAFFELGVDGSLTTHMPPPFTPVYVGFGLGVTVDGEIQIHYANSNFSYYTEIGPALAANIALGVGERKADFYIEGGLEGTFRAELKGGNGIFASRVDYPFKAYLRGDLFVRGTAFGWINADWNWQIGDELQLYPYNEISLMSAEATNKESIKSFIDNSTPLPRDYLYTINLFSLDNSNKLYSDKSIYPYNTPILTKVSNDNIMLLWIDDLGTKNDINKTSLMYSVYDGVSWSKATELFETGTYNGAPVVYNDGNSLHMVWRKAKTEFDDSANLENLISDTELYYTEYSNGTFKEPVQITDNTFVESDYQLIANGNNIAIGWVENTDNNPYMTSGKNKLYVKEFVTDTWNESFLIKESTQTISEVIPYYTDNELKCAYTIVDENNVANLYVDNKNVCSGNYFKLYNNKIFYLFESDIKYYDISTGVVEDTVLSGVSNFDIYNGNIYTLVNDGFKSELYESICTGDLFSSWEQVTEFDKYIRDYYVTTDSVGEPVYALNLVSINEGENIYGASELAVCKASDINALEVKAVYYDETNVAPSVSLPLNIDVTNVGTTNISSLNISITDSEGTILSSGAVDTEIVSGESATIVYNYTLPSELELYDITVTVTSSENEINLDNNCATTSIGYTDIIVQDVVVERTENGAVASGSIYNAGYSDATNVVLSIYNASYPDEVLATIDCADIALGEVYDFTYDIPEKYLSLEDKMTMYGLNFEAGSDSKELNYANNTEKVVFGELTDYTVAFVDGNQLLDIVSVDEFESYSVDKAGYTLEGWYTSSLFEYDSKIEVIPTDISENLIVFAKWIPMAINKAEYVNKSINVNATVSEELLSESGIIVLAIYQNEKLVAMHSMDITSSIDYSFDDISEADNYDIKMFCWKGLGNLKPLCGAISTDVK